MKSAYFENSEENSVIKNATANSYQHAAAGTKEFHASDYRSGGISFPYNKEVLWNREAISFPKYVKAVDVVPSLLLAPADVNFLLGKLCGDSAQKSEVILSTSHYCQLSDHQKILIGVPFLGIPNYIFSGKLSSVSINPSLSLTVPITCAQSMDKSLPFDEASTTYVLDFNSYSLCNFLLLSASLFVLCVC
jgi:hypothetical protein